MTLWRGVRSPPLHSPEIIMEKEELEALVHEVHEKRLLLDNERKIQAAARAAARCLLRDDVASVEIRADGTLWCTDHEGRKTLRAAGWRGRS